MHQRSTSPHDLMRKLNTDRSQHIPFSSRNSQSNIFDYSIHKHKNSSQLITKNDKKADNQKPQARKKSLSSYYFRNYKKNGKNTDTQTFSKYLKSKNQHSHKNQNDYNNQNKKRCITAINLTTDKDFVTTQISNNKQSKTYLRMDLDFLDNCELYCKNHPSKLAYFESLESIDCYCHQCSINCVKENNRLIQLSPQIQKVKKIIEKKVIQTQTYGDELCSIIQQKISQNIKELETQYKQLKMQICSQNFEHQYLKKNIEFQLQEIDWSFISQVNQRLSGEVKIPQLQFLQPVKQKYQVKRSHKQQEQIQNITIHEFNQDFEMSPVPLISSTEKERIEKVWNLNPKPKKNLIKEIENALNYQSRKTKHLKVKSISLKNDKNLKGYQDYLNQENIEPNLMQENISLTNGNTKEMKRIAFGNFL